METSNVSHLLIISISLLIFSRIGTFNNQCNHLSVLHDGKPERLLLAESEKKVWTERNRQRDVSISAPPPRSEGGRAVGYVIVKQLSTRYHGG